MPNQPAAPTESASPFHQVARDNSGSVTPPLATHTQKPDAPMPGSRAWAEARSGKQPTAVERSQMTPTQRFQQDQSHIDDLTFSGPSYVHKRDDNGNVTITERATGRIVQGQGVNNDQPAPPVVEGEKFKIGQYEVSEAELGTMMQRQAAEDLRRATIPATPEAYKLELSPDAKLPGDVEYKFNASDPSLAALRTWAHAKGFDQSTLSEMLTIYATHEAQQNVALAERSRAEVAKAGVNAPQRVDAVGKWITSIAGEADAKPIRATLVTDAHLRFYEKLMNKDVSQGTAPFSQQHRELAPKSGQVTEDQWSKMSPADRMDYTNKTDQSQFRSTR